MAGSAADISLPNSSFFNIYNDGLPVARSSPTSNFLGGHCNFVDLSQGANGPKCGCRRFWSRGASGQYGSAGLSGYPRGGSMGIQADEAFFCMCSHHACFHDDIQDFQVPVFPTTTTNSGQENERPRGSREPLTPVLPELPFQMPLPADQSKDLQAFNNASCSANFQDTSVPQGEMATTGREPSLPDTLAWTNLVQTPTGHQASILPSIPSQCLVSSQPSSTTSSVRMRYLQPFAGKGLQTLSCAKSKLRETQLQKDLETLPQVEDNLEQAVDPSEDDQRTVTNTPRSTRHADTSDRGSQNRPIARQTHEALQQLTNTVESHEERIDRLETASVSMGHEDCHDIHDQTDLRVTELETRVDEVEKILNDNSSCASSHHRYRRSGADDNSASVVSVSTDISGRADRAELHIELQNLKEQLGQLQGLSHFPSYTHPWEVEVIFLPFPLKGVWMQSRDFASQRLSSGSNLNVIQRTQLPSSSSVAEQQSPGFHEWVTPELESQWLLARACAPDRMIEKRLRSRGLVKTVSIRGSDARSVHQAINAAFGTSFCAFSRMQANAYQDPTTHPRVTSFMGLQQQWVPLRKIHKDSRLRFLSPAEMITPATWDFSFLSSSVVMKATGIQRLFLTQPEAYLQDQYAFDNGWCWQRLRELSRVYPDSQSSQQQTPEADAMEDYWTWNDRLDEKSSSQSSSLSLSLRQAAQSRARSRLRSISSSPCPPQLFASHTGISPSLSTRSRAQSPMVPLKERMSTSRPTYIRTTSVPLHTIPLASPALSKCRVTSATHPGIHPHPYERFSSPQLVRASTSKSHAFAMAKRMRRTRSPSVPLSARLRRNTPRWSTRSPSPMVDAFSLGIGPHVSTGCRQPTPSYYATPYSNAPFVEAKSNHPGVEPDGDAGSVTDSYDMADNVGQDSEEDQSDYDADGVMLNLGHLHCRHEDDDGWGQEVPNHPEDEVWPGIEDEENRDPESFVFGNSGNGINVYVDKDAMSDVEDGDATDVNVDRMSVRSSVPSEYPSTQHAWAEGHDGFKVFDGQGGQQ